MILAQWNFQIFHHRYKSPTALLLFAQFKLWKIFLLIKDQHFLAGVQYYLAIFVVSIIFPLFELLRLAQYSQELSQMMEIVVDKIIMSGRFVCIQIGCEYRYLYFIILMKYLNNRGDLCQKSNSEY